MSLPLRYSSEDSQRALRLRNVRPLPFAPCKGALGFFRLPAGVVIKEVA